MMDICSEKCTIMRYSHCANITEFTKLDGIACNTSRRYGIAIALGYKPVWHVTVQNNKRLNLTQEKLMQSRNSGHEIYEVADSII